MVRRVSVRRRYPPLPASKRMRVSIHQSTSPQRPCFPCWIGGGDLPFSFGDFYPAPLFNWGIFPCSPFQPGMAFFPSDSGVSPQGGSAGIHAGRGFCGTCASRSCLGRCSRRFTIRSRARSRSASCTTRSVSDNPFERRVKFEKACMANENYYTDALLLLV